MSHTIALAGNPNTGKSTLFNALTGSQQHTGNWPGKTVEKKEGTWRYDGQEFLLVDLPGAYSLSAFSLEEIITRDFIIEARPGVMVIVVDAANLERNLYLVVQILEMGVNAVMVLNMSDMAAARGLQIDVDALSRRLGVPIVPAIARKGQGLDDLKRVIAEAARRPNPAAEWGQMATQVLTFPRATVQVDYGADVEAAIARLQALIERHDVLNARYPGRWLAIKLLEEDSDLSARIAEMADTEALMAETRESIADLRAVYGDDLDAIIADHRYSWINRLVRETVQQGGASLTPSDRIDRVVTHRWLGIPIFFVAMWFVFKLTTDITAPYLDWIEAALTGPISAWAARFLSLIGLGGSWVQSLVVDGVIAGVGGVLVFVPVLMALYLCLALLEDTGYMARAAFVMDKQMRMVGLHGKSFVPLVVGFGCNVPAIYATRTLENRRDRILTGLLVPFMSCGARLPVYILFAAVFFPRYSSIAVFSMYLIGIAMAVLVGVVFKHTIFKADEQSGMLMELPPYRLPTIRNTWNYMWVRTKDFLRGAATIILLTSIVVWALMAIPVRSDGAFADTEVENSAFGAISGALAPVFAPLGFGTWQASSSLLSGFVAKEVVVSTLAQAYNADAGEAVSTPTGIVAGVTELASGFAQATLDTFKSIPLLFGINLFHEQADEAPTSLATAIHAGFTQSSGGHAALAGFAFMVFVLLYTPCMVVVAAQRHEFGAKWMWTSVIGQFLLAWAAAFLIFQIGKLIAG